MENRDRRGCYSEKIHLDNYVRLKKEQVDPEGMNNLIQAIVHAAAYDYKKSKDWFMRQDAREFFESEWFTFLTGISGKYMIELLNNNEIIRPKDDDPCD